MFRRWRAAELVASALAHPPEVVPPGARRDINTFLVALLRGELLAPAQLAEMKSGLGLESLPLACGPAWTHGGDAPGFHVRAAVTDDGSRSAAISITAEFTAELDAHTDPIVERLLCARAD